MEKCAGMGGSACAARAIPPNNADITNNTKKIIPQVSEGCCNKHIFRKKLPIYAAK